MTMVTSNRLPFARKSSLSIEAGDRGQGQDREMSADRSRDRERDRESLSIDAVRDGSVQGVSNSL